MPLPNLPVLGVRFDIDKLLKYSGGNYAETAWTVIWQSLDPALLKGASLWHGDSGATLNHRENVFCIAIQSSDAGSLKQAQSLLAGSSELGGVAAVPPFAEGDDVIGEPLPGDGHVDFRGEIVGQSFHARPALLRARPAAEAARAVPNEIADQEITQDASSANEAPAQATADAPTSVAQVWAEAAPSHPVDANAPQEPQLTFRKLLFSFEGRIGNGAYLAGVLLPLAALFGAGLVIAPFAALVGPVTRGSGMETFFTVVGVLALVAAMILWLWTKLAVAVKRCHDMNINGAVLLVCLIPYVGILVFLWLVFGPGTEGANRWGHTMRMR